MQHLPVQPGLGHLKKQAKQLLAELRGGEAMTLARMRIHLPVATSQPDSAIIGMSLQLRDAQSCIAREYGFASWSELAGFVSLRSTHAIDPARGLLHWLSLVYAGDIAGGMNRTQPTVAVR